MSTIALRIAQIHKMTRKQLITECRCQFLTIDLRSSNVQLQNALITDINGLFYTRNNSLEVPVNALRRVTTGVNQSLTFHSSNVSTRGIGFDKNKRTQLTN